MLRGTRVMRGSEAMTYVDTINRLRSVVRMNQYEELIVPTIWETQTFVDKAGPEIVGQMYTFRDKGDRDCCLIPEVTGIVQDLWRAGWDKSEKKPMRVFYVARCYRYERPQAGRYREFTQFGVEHLGGHGPADRDEVVELLQVCLRGLDINYALDASVKRGLSYYTEDGFEARCDQLGAQKQVAGGGRYAEGIGWAIGVDRVMLARQGEVVP
jgi:histidyl-tRNA synthetase